MEGISTTAGTLEEGEVVWQIRTRARILHTQTHRSTTATLLHMKPMCYTQRELCAHRCTNTHTAVTMLSAQRISSAVYTPAFTCD